MGHPDGGGITGVGVEVLLLVRLTPVDAIMGLMRGGQEAGQLQLMAQLELGVETTSLHSACSSQWFLWLFTSFCWLCIGQIPDVIG